MATTKPRGKIIEFTDLVARYIKHHADGAAGQFGLEIHMVPFDYAQMYVDLEALMIEAKIV